MAEDNPRDVGRMGSAPPPTLGMRTPPRPEAGEEVIPQRQRTPPKPSKQAQNKQGDDARKWETSLRGDAKFDDDEIYGRFAKILVGLVNGASIQDACLNVGISNAAFSIILREYPHLRREYREVLVDIGDQHYTKIPGFIADAANASTPSDVAGAKAGADICRQIYKMAQEIEKGLSKEVASRGHKTKPASFSGAGAPKYNPKEDAEYARTKPKARPKV